MTNSDTCPVCKSNKEKILVSKVNVQTSAGYFCPESKDIALNKKFVEKISLLWQGDEAEVLRCLECGFGFSSPFVGGDFEFYDLKSSYTGYTAWKWDYNYTLSKLLTSSNNQSCQILDIGAGEGLFLKRLNNSYTKYAIESSNKNATQLALNGINVINSMEDATRDFKDHFDIIVLFQVLEHISEFEMILRNISTLLKKNGKLILSVPNGESVLIQEKYFSGIDMIPNHVNKWTDNSLSIALADFTNLKIIYEPKSITREVKSILYGYIKLMAARNITIYSNIYLVKNRFVKLLLMGILCIPAIPKALKAVKEIKHPNLIATCQKK